MRILAIAGRSGSGKTTCARALEERGWVRLSLADPVKDLARVLYALSEEQVRGKLKDVPVTGSRSTTPRETIVALGRRLRESLGEGVIVSALLARTDRLYPGSSIVVDDLRYPREAELLRASGRDVRVARLDPTDVDQRVEDDAAVDLVAADVVVGGYVAAGDMREGVLRYVAGWR